MAKNIFLDVLPKGRKSIRDIPIPSRRQKPDLPARRDERMSDDFRPPSRRRWRLWGAGIFSFLLLAFVLSLIFSGASLTVIPRQETIAIDATLTAKRSGGDLTYSTLAISRTKDEVVPADGEKKLERKASGQIIIYNDYAAANQRLIRNTRFETPEGLIYRIDQSVVIPGKRSVGGKSVPGSVEALVYADSPGKDYNIGLTDFTIPGFKSDPVRFKSFYARSKTPTTGGFIGNVKTISPEKLTAAQDRIRAALSAELISEVKKNLTDPNLILYNGSYKLQFEHRENGETTGNDVTVGEKGAITAFVLKRDELAARIAARSVLNYDSSPVALEGPEKLSFELENPADDFTKPATPFIFRLSGAARIVWLFDAEKLKADLAGKPKNVAPSVLARYPSIARAEHINVRPFWKRSFPDDVRKIKIERQLNSSAVTANPSVPAASGESI